MIKVVIIEDEAPARKKLKNYIEKIGESIEILKELETVEDSINYFKTAPEVDLIFSDIELRDANVFELYNQATISCPIIFTTAYDQFWMNAFETNGIEYLLKPYSFNRFEKAWNKFIVLKSNKTEEHLDLFKKLDTFYQNKMVSTPTYKEYIPVKSSKGIYFLKVLDIVFIQADYGVIFAYDTVNKKHLLNQTSLKEIQNLVNPSTFFKINRSELINRNYVEKINRYNKNTLSVCLKSHTLKTSQNQTAAFNAWMGI